MHATKFIQYSLAFTMKLYSFPPKQLKYSNGFLMRRLCLSYGSLYVSCYLCYFMQSFMFDENFFIPLAIAGCSWLQRLYILSNVTNVKFKQINIATYSHHIYVKYQPAINRIAYITLPRAFSVKSYQISQYQPSLSPITINTDQWHFAIFLLWRALHK